MKILFIVINNEEHLRELVEEFAENDIKGGTILESKGLGNLTNKYIEEGYFTYLKIFMPSPINYNKTIFLVLDDEKIYIAKKCVRKILGDMSKANTGIMFTLNVDDVEGLTK